MGRVTYALIAAVIGAALALLDHAFLAGPHFGYFPQNEGWGFYFWLCAPWAVGGAIVGYWFGRRRKPKSTSG
jgi:hypothetical protein